MNIFTNQEQFIPRSANIQSGIKVRNSIDLTNLSNLQTPFQGYNNQAKTTKIQQEVDIQEIIQDQLEMFLNNQILEKILIMRDQILLQTKHEIDIMRTTQEKQYQLAIEQINLLQTQQNNIIQKFEKQSELERQIQQLNEKVEKSIQIQQKLQDINKVTTQKQPEKEKFEVFNNEQQSQIQRIKQDFTELLKLNNEETQKEIKLLEIDLKKNSFKNQQEIILIINYKYDDLLNMIQQNPRGYTSTSPGSRKASREQYEEKNINTLNVKDDYDIYKIQLQQKAYDQNLKELENKEEVSSEEFNYGGKILKKLTQMIIQSTKMGTTQLTRVNQLVLEGQYIKYTQESLNYLKSNNLYQD